MLISLENREPWRIGTMIPPPDPEIKTVMSWPAIHYLEASLPTAIENVGLDEALLVEAEELEGPAILRIWELGHLAVVLGASCRITENVPVEVCELDHVEIARRSSGGGTVVIGPGALNFSVVLPIDAAPELRNVDTAQRYVLARTLDAIRAEGVDSAEMLGSGDLTIAGRKFSGSAQRRLRRHVLIHASLLYGFPLEAIERYSRMPPRRPAYRGDRPHEEFVTNLPLPRDRLIAAIRAAWLPVGRPIRLAEIPTSTLGSLLDSKFSKVEWIGRL